MYICIYVYIYIYVWLLYMSQLLNFSVFDLDRGSAQLALLPDAVRS